MDKSQFSIEKWEAIHPPVNNIDEKGEKIKRTAPSAKELDNIVNTFIDHALEYRGKPHNKDGADGKLTELDLSVMFEELMKKHAPRDAKG